MTVSSLERRLDGLVRRLDALVWMCAANIALMLLATARVFGLI